MPAAAHHQQVRPVSGLQQNPRRVPLSHPLTDADRAGRINRAGDNITEDIPGHPREIRDTGHAEGCQAESGRRQLRLPRYDRIDPAAGQFRLLDGPAQRLPG
jgi:hypothetical protein